MTNGQFFETAQERLTRYRRLAARAREVAGNTDAEDIRIGYAGLAQSWEDLADQLERHKEQEFPTAPRPAPSFGATDQPKCENCGVNTGLVRRMPHPTLGPEYELQSFACAKCGHVQTRDADGRGQVPR